MPTLPTRLERLDKLTKNISVELGPRSRGNSTVFPTIQEGGDFERAVSVFVGYKECHPDITKALVIMNPGKIWHSFEFQLHNSWAIVM
jgi:hypothetical protein